MPDLSMTTSGGRAAEGVPFHDKSLPSWICSMEKVNEGGSVRAVDEKNSVLSTSSIRDEDVLEARRDSPLPKGSSGLSETSLMEMAVLPARSRKAGFGGLKLESFR